MQRAHAVFPSTLYEFCNDLYLTFFGSGERTFQSSLLPSTMNGWLPVRLVRLGKGYINNSEESIFSIAFYCCRIHPFTNEVIPSLFCEQDRF